MIIKVPDFDKALNYWRKGDISFFKSAWNIESVAALWQKQGVCDCIHHRATMIFCSFFHKAFGNPFDGKPSKRKSSRRAFMDHYFGLYVNPRYPLPSPL